MEKGSKPKIKQVDPWAGFKRLSSDDANVPAKEPRREKTPSPYVCLKCGTEMARGRDFYKKRHGEQKHANEPPGQYNTMIVPVDHERAVRMRREKKTNDDLSLPTTQTKEKLVSSENSSMLEDGVFDDSSNQSLRVFDNNTSCSEKSTTRDVPRCSSTCSKTVQKSLASFIVHQ